jgi:hypothetical protein
MSHQMHRTGLFATVGVLLSFTAAGHAESPDLSSPKSAEKAYYIAENSGDVSSFEPYIQPALVCVFFQS